MPFMPRGTLGHVRGINRTQQKIVSINIKTGHSKDLEVQKRQLFPFFTIFSYIYIYIYIYIVITSAIHSSLIYCTMFISNPYAAGG